MPWKESGGMLPSRLPATVQSDFFAAGKTAATSPKNDGQAYFAGNQR
jgi:hypothetical protein